MPAAAGQGLRFCVVGSGPAGFYALSALLKRLPSCRVDIVERLPVPFGLLRYGVAPDHPEARAVTKSFTTLMTDNPAVRFFGNVRVGEKGFVSVSELRRLYSGVIVAVGCPEERVLGVAGEELAGVRGAGDFVKWYNGHPDCGLGEFQLDRVNEVAVIGNGNVALDVGRVLLRSVDDLRKSDMPEYVLDEFTRSRVKTVSIIGRRGLAQAAWTAKELRECLGGINGAFAVDLRQSEIGLQAEDIEELKSRRKKRRCAEMVQKYAVNLSGSDSGVASGTPSNRRMLLRFLNSPTAFLSSSKGDLTHVRLHRNTLIGAPGSRKAVPAENTTPELLSCQLALRSIGYRGKGIPEILFDDLTGTYVNERGRIEDGLYCVGWCKRGPQGIIGDNLWDAEETMENVARDAAMGKLVHRGAIRSSYFGNYVDWDGWLRIDKEERKRGCRLGKEREKIVEVEQMVQVAHDGSPRGAVYVAK